MTTIDPWAPLDAALAQLEHKKRHEAARRFKDASDYADEIFRVKRDEYVRSFEIEMQKLLAIGKRMGIPNRQLALRGMGYKNGTTARLAAEAGEAFLSAEVVEGAPEVIEAEAPRFALNDGVLTVTCQPSEFDGKIVGITEPQTLAFYVDGERLTPEGADYSHPVARLALTPDGRKEIAAYLAGVAA